MKTYFRLLIRCTIILNICSMASLYAQDKSWKVWVKTSPTSGRTDWITVAKSNPTAGTNFYYLANQIFPGTSCTLTGCTFQQATAVANSLRTSNEFFKYCSREYSVWKNTSTGKMSVVVSKYGTAGYGWEFVKGDLCCEEAEALAGITGVCSNTKPIQPPVQCWPGSHPAYNSKSRRTECFCNKGLVWNSTKTACVDPKVLVAATDCSAYPGSYAAYNYQTQRVECWCPEGKTWNKEGNACVDVVSQVNCWPGSHAVFNSQTNRTECFCNTGLVWNSTKTACVDPKELVRNTDCSAYPGSYAAYNEQTQRVECWCPAGKVWNSTKTACVDNVTQVACWPGSYAAYNSQTKRTECFCNPGLVWNETKTACIDPGKTTVAGETWRLVSATVNPATPSNGWRYNGQSTSAHMDVYNGDKADFQWTAPPQQFDKNGFTVSLKVTENPAPNNRMASLIAIGASGLNSDIPRDQWSAYATTENGVAASAQKTITFKPSYSQVEYKISLMWGAVEFIYKYQKQ